MSAFKKSLVATAAMALSLGAQAAFAATGNDGSRAVQLTGPAVMLGVTVPAGSYTLHWTREHGSESVQIEIMEGRKVLAAGKGAWIASPETSPYDALVYRPENGANALSEIRFRNSADSIRIGPGAARAEARQQSATGTTVSQ